MGDVWQAVHERHGLLVAVKLLYVRTDSVESAVPSEFSMLARFRDDNIVRVLDTGEYRDAEGRCTAYVVMEYIPGAQSIIDDADKRNLDVRGRLAQFVQACSAAACVHKAADMHLDIKPENLLVDLRGRVYLADFGIARQVVCGPRRAHVGTVAYMSPERLQRRDDEIDQRADVWSLGALLYRLLSGADAFGLSDEADIGQRLQAIARGPVPLAEANERLLSAAPELLPGLEAVIRGCLAPLPSGRYDNASQLLEAVHRVQESVGVRGRMMMLRRRRPRVWAAVAALLLTIPATLAALSVTSPALARWPAAREWIGAMMPAPTASPARGTALQDVVIVEFGEETASTLAGKPGLETFTPGPQRASHRPMHAAMIRNLVDAGVRTIVFDIFFSFEHDSDGALAEAVRFALAQGITVVIGANSWRWENDMPVMSPVVWAAGPHWGGATVGHDSHHFWIDLMVERDGLEPMPSLSLAGFAAHRWPGWFVEYRVAGDVILLRPYEADPVRPERRHYQAAPFEVRPSAVVTIDRAEQATYGLELGDRDHFFIVEIPGDDAVAASSITYEALWAMSREQRMRRLSGRLAMIANRYDDHPFAGSRVRGAVVHATAVQSMLLRQATRLRSAWNLPLSFGGAVVGFVAVMVFAPRVRLRVGSGLSRGLGAAATFILAIIIAAALLAAITVAVRWSSGTWLHAAPGLTAAALTAAGALLLFPGRRLPRRSPARTDFQSVATFQKGVSA